MGQLTKMFERFLDAPRRNAGGPRGEDEYTAFLRELSATGELKTYSEADWIQKIGRAHV